MIPQGFAANPEHYVIIGGSIARVRVAARLTEDPACIAAVVEAGADGLNDPTILTPALWPAMIGDPKYDYCHKTLPHARTFSPLKN
jgi:choline dehydrogenase-like flavoprotein